jgi:hypothetical protein
MQDSLEYAMGFMAACLGGGDFQVWEREGGMLTCKHLWPTPSNMLLAAFELARRGVVSNAAVLGALMWYLSQEDKRELARICADRHAGCSGVLECVIAPEYHALCSQLEAVHRGDVSPNDLDL